MTPLHLSARFDADTGQWVVLRPLTEQKRRELMKELERRLLAMMRPLATKGDA